MSQNNEVRQALAFVENAVDALSDVSLQAAATTLAAEIRRLQAVNQTVNAIWEDVDAYARNHSEIQLGGSVSQHALKLMKERDALAAVLKEAQEQKPVAFWWIGEGGENHGGPYRGMASEFAIDNARNSGCSPQYLYAGPVPAVAAGLPAIGPYRDFIPAPAEPTVAVPAVQDDCVSQDESTMMMAASALALYRAGESAEYMAKAIEAMLQSAPQAPAVPEEWRESTKAMLLSLDEAIRAGNAVYVRQEDKVVNHRHCWMRFHEKRQAVEALLQSAPPPPKKD